jgi:hypothetical protein
MADKNCTYITSSLLCHLVEMLFILQLLNKIMIETKNQPNTLFNHDIHIKNDINFIVEDKIENQKYEVQIKSFKVKNLF